MVFQSRASLVERVRRSPQQANLSDLPKWYESYRHNLAKSTQYSYGSDINLYLIPMLGEVPLNKLTPKMIDDTSSNWQITRMY